MEYSDYFSLPDDGDLEEWKLFIPDRQLPKTDLLKKNINVLLIEDNDGDWYLVREMFSEINSSIALEHTLNLERANLLKEAILKLEKKSYEVVLLDLSLPDSSGIETLSELKLKFPDSAVIVFSGLSDLDTAICAVYDGAQDYIVKGQTDSNTLYRSILYAFERKKRELDRIQLEAQVNHTERLKSLGLLAGGIAHDFNNLLMVMLSNMELLGSDLKAQGTAVEKLKYLNNAEQAAQLASGLTKQLLAYSGISVSSLEKVNLTKCLSGLRDLLKTAIHVNARINFELSDDLPDVEVDLSQLNQIIMNLVINASDAMQGKPGVIKVRTGITDVTEKEIIYSPIKGERTPGQYAYFDVEDQGKGMSEEVKKKIFDPFFSTKGAGRGLGLSAVWGILENMKGLIDITSEEGKGTNFRVLFKALPRSEKKASKIADNKLAWEGSGSILIVDDNQLVSEVTANLLRSHKFDVITAHRGQEGIDLFGEKHHLIKLVILDLTMPDMNGLDVFKRIRQVRHDIPVVFSSGYAPSKEIDAVSQQSGSGFLQKPYSHETLVTVIRKLIDDK